jgi:hypothetical protein
MGASSCEKKPNAYKCVTIEEKGQMLFRCKNSETNDAFTSDISILGRCINDRNRECPWFLTDSNNFERMRLFYKEQCSQ